MLTNNVDESWGRVVEIRREMERALESASTGGDEASPAERLLLESAGAVRQRRGDYGPPGEHFERTAAMLNAAFPGLFSRPVEARDWALMMICDKIARLQGASATKDSVVDIAGYAACLFEVSPWGK